MLPENWELVELGDYLEVKGGSQPPKSEFIYEPKDGYIRLLQIRDFGDKPVPTYVRKDSVTKFCDKDDILIARYGASLGRIVTGMKGAYNVALAKVIAEPNEFLNRYLFYLLKTPIFQTPLTMISRSAQNGFAKHEIAKVELPKPPLPTQHRIVEKLEELFSELDNGVENLKKAQQQLKTYRQAVLKDAFEGKLTKEWRALRQAQGESLPSPEELLEQIKAEREAYYAQQLADWENEVEQWEKDGKEGRKPGKPRKQKTIQSLTKDGLKDLPDIPSSWKWAKLGNVAKDMCLGKMLDKKKNEGEFEVYLGNINVRWGKFDLVELKEMRFLETEHERYNLELGDLVICEGGEPGRCAVWKSENDMKIQKALHRVRFFQTKTISDFIYYYFFYQAKTGHISKYFTGTTIKHLTGTGLMEVEIPLLPAKEQNQIVQEIESRLSIVDQLEKTIAESLQKAEALRQSILKKAFNGELVVEQ